MRDLSAVLADFSLLATEVGLLLTAIILMAAKACHEIGHGLAAKHFGCTVPAMGVALILLWPLLWTDTTEGWKLRRRRDRLLIDGGGLIAETYLAAIASILWSVAPEGGFKMSMHILASIGWISTLAINVNPFMRFDGYYLLSDALDVPNLQSRSFALARWRIKTAILGTSDPPPETVPPRFLWFLVSFAILTWLYRLVLFLTIALIVYHFFFKALGLALFVIEIWWLILRPILRELGSWRGSVLTPFRSWRGPIYLLLLGALGAWLLVPMPGRVAVPAMLHAAQESLVQSPGPGQIQELHLKEGHRVNPGDPLLTVAMPDLDRQRANTISDLRLAEAELSQAALSPNHLELIDRLRGQIRQLSANLTRIDAEAAALALTSPIAGTIRDVGPGLAAGDWVTAREPLAIIVSDAHVVTLYVPASLRRRIDRAAPLWFSAAGAPTRRIAARWDALGQAPVARIEETAMISPFGGPIVTNPNRGSQTAPQDTWYLGKATPIQGPTRETGPGFAIVRTSPERRLTRWAQQVQALILRERGC